MTIRSLLETFALKTPDAIAQKYNHAKAWHQRTYAEMLRGVRQMAEAYGPRFALKPQQDNVALILANGPDWLESYLACSGTGVSVVPLDPKLHNDEVQYILHDSGAVVVTTDLAHLEMMAAIAPRLPALRAVVIVDGGAPSYAAIGQIPVYDYESLRVAFADGKASWYDAHVAQPEDIASIIYTSGTTGQPKGAMLTHANFCSDAEGAYGAFEEPVTAADTFLVVLPLFHAFSFTTNFVVPMMRGCGMYFVESLRTIGDDIKTLGPSIVMAVPLLAEKVYDKIDAKLQASPVARALLKIGLKGLVAKSIKKGLGGNLRFMIVGGAPCPQHVLEGYRAIGISVLEGYGLTECAPVVSIAGPRCARIGTIGHKLTNIDIRLADPNEQGVGELQIRGPIAMKGYYHNDAATKEAFDGDWLRTGDLAALGDDGLLTIRGRKKALIVNREGKNIYPEEVENQIARDPIVADCVVIGYTVGGVPGERVGAVVHPNVDLLTEQNHGTPRSWDAMEKLAAAHVHARCADLADYKRPRKVVVLREPLERTSIQKVRRVTYQKTLDEK